jgi:hypothetical protein
MSNTRFETVGQYHDLWAHILLSAPDHFMSWNDQPVDQSQQLELRFQELMDGFYMAERKLKDPRLIRICRELLDMSLQAYKAGDTKLGAHTLQECEGLIWKSRRNSLKHVVEAERRAFGTVELFKDVVVSPYPYEGAEADLGEVQRRLWLHIADSCKPELDETEGFRQIWSMQADGSIRRIQARSYRAAKEQLIRQIERAEVIGAASVEVLPGGDLQVFDVEEPGRPRVSIRVLRSGGAYKAPRFHLEHPSMFQSPGDAQGA